ncbi:hypothetical protein GGF32_002219 [Allomyces javanicus]|nr:hypothetical protein GGF32_002219 [Allomyces javanicus]
MEPMADEDYGPIQVFSIFNLTLCGVCDFTLRQLAMDMLVCQKSTWPSDFITSGVASPTIIDPTVTNFAGRPLPGLAEALELPAGRAFTPDTELDSVQLLTFVRELVHSEQDPLRFDYLGLHARCVDVLWGIARDLCNKLVPQFGAKCYNELRSEPTLVVGYIIEDWWYESLAQFAGGRASLGMIYDTADALRKWTTTHGALGAANPNPAAADQLSPDDFQPGIDDAGQERARLPVNLLNSYRMYKEDTNKLATWLVATAQSIPKPSHVAPGRSDRKSSRLVPVSRAAKSKERKAAVFEFLTPHCVARTRAPAAAQLNDITSLSNQFAVLSPLDKDEDHDYNVDDEADGDDDFTVRVTTNATAPTRSGVTYQSEDDFMDALLAIEGLEESADIRWFVRDTWEQSRDGKLDLVTASLVTNAAVALAIAQ